MSTPLYPLSLSRIALCGCVAFTPKPTTLAYEKGTHRECHYASRRDERQQDLLNRNATDVSEDEGHSGRCYDEVVKQ
jgi:hypothetical protein